ncbi:MAG: hypothetical protein ACRDHI_11325 [Actinomycetota bacterium]
MAVKQRKRPATDVEVIRAGSRYVWGRGRDFYGIWDQKHPDDPVATFDGSSRSDGWRYFQRLEWEAKPIKHRHRVGRWIRRFLVAVLAVIVVALLGLVGFLLVDNRTLEGSLFDLAGDAPAPTEPALGSTLVRHENAEGGYAFRHPSGWAVVDRSTGTELSSTSEQVSISFEVTSEPRIGVAAESIARTFSGGWTDVVVEPLQSRKVAAFDAISISGTGTDDSGRALRFLVIAVEGGTRNFAIRVVVPREYDPSATQPQIEEVVSSFEPL